MSGSAFSGSRNTTRPPPRTSCIVFFYRWRCGHEQWVHCLGCDIPGEPSSHLNHPHEQHQLPAAGHRCPVPTCGQPSEDELARAPLLGDNMPPSVRSSLRMLREQNNHPENIRARILRDVAATMDAWREPPITEDMTREQLVAMIGRNINDDRADVVEAHQSLEDLLTAPTTLLQPLPAPLAPLPRPQTETNGLTNGPAVQGAPPQLSGGYEPDGHAVQNLPNGVLPNGPPPHRGNRGGNGRRGPRGHGGIQRGQHPRGPRGPRGARGGSSRGQYNSQPRQPSQLRNGYLPEDGESDPEGARRR